MKKILLLLSVVTCTIANSQELFKPMKVFVQGGFGVQSSKEIFSPYGDIQIGLRAGNFFVSNGYIAGFDNGLPMLLNARLGYMHSERFIVYAGYVRVQQSSVVKKSNSNSWQVGLQRNISYYKRGTFYANITYTHKQSLSAGLGMTLNLVKRDDE